MKNHKFPSLMICAFLLIPALISCSMLKEVANDKSSEYNLIYKIPVDKSYKVSQLSDFKQSMSIRGQDIDITSNTSNYFTLSCKNYEDENMSLRVKIDSFNTKVVTPRETLVPETDLLSDKEFSIVISNKGKELDYSESESLTYSFSQGEQRDLSAEFQNLFPDMPEKEISIGERWISHDTIKIKSAGNYMHLITKNKNLLEGIETYKGTKCAKVSSTSEGKMFGEGESQGVKTKSEGEIKGKSIFYFSIDDGIILYINSEGEVEGNTVVYSEEKINIPSKRIFKIETTFN